MFSGLVLLFLEPALNPAKVTLPLFLNKVGSWLSKKAQLLMTPSGSSRLVFGDIDRVLGVLLKLLVLIWFEYAIS